MMIRIWQIVLLVLGVENEFNFECSAAMDHE